MVSIGELKRLRLAGAAAVALMGSARADERPTIECYSTSQTRDAIFAHKLAEPFGMMRAAGNQMQGDPIGARLCKIHDEFIYEVSLLRRDGRIMKILVDATTGAPHVPGKEHAPETRPQGEQSAPARH